MRWQGAGAHGGVSTDSSIATVAADSWCARRRSGSGPSGVVVLSRKNRAWDMALNPDDQIRVSVCASALLLAVLALTSRFEVAPLVYAALAPSFQVTVINGITHRQEVTPDQLQSRVNVVGRMIARGGQPFGAILGVRGRQFRPSSLTPRYVASA